FTPVFRFGHHLYVSTTVNKKATGLFLIDTGSAISAIDATFARLTTKIHGDEYMHVHGVSGSVRDVFEADKAELRFGRFAQRNLGLTSFNLNNSPEHQEVRMDGILGAPVLSLFHLSLDYRNGLVNFDYVLQRK
ncbi:MAG: aspartyl protease family protein, partial [Acidobacteriaceae bacterium]|nr:aspartyl protease family protein [Acidobacteriaceae bacterium]